ncbi:MAG: nucleotidyltransferase family protein [Clostridia bacterium]|nr:nucleotidyltransferase family protein [Clostridia bacterium]
MKDEMSLFFSLLRCGVGEPVALPPVLSAPRLEAAYTLAKRYDLTHLLGQALTGLSPDRLPPDSLVVGKLQRGLLLAMYRGEQIGHELAALEGAQIPFMPLKGAVLRQLYGQPWMRTSGDIDVLVHRDDLERASACLTDTLGYQRDKAGAHDVSFFTPGGVHIELHYDLVEDGRAGKAAAVLSRVWELSRPVGTDSYRWEMPDELFYFYHIALMAKQVETGGCGVRPFLDLWLLNEQPHDWGRREALLRQGGLIRFGAVCRELAGCWFSGVQTAGTALQLETYILGGGVYGSRENRTAVEQSRQGGKGRYVLGRLFPAISALQYDFPVLKKHPWVLPGCWLWRWGRLLFGGRLRRSVKEMKTGRPAAEDAATLLENIGL